jgi:hypothetical protein
VTGKDGFLTFVWGGKGALRTALPDEVSPDNPPVDARIIKTRCMGICPAALKKKPPAFSPRAQGDVPAPLYRGLAGVSPNFL